jgi:hypothetical protein
MLLEADGFCVQGKNCMFPMDKETQDFESIVGAWDPSDQCDKETGTGMGAVFVCCVSQE